MGFLPDNYKTSNEIKAGGKDPRYIEFNKRLKDGESIDIYLCGTHGSGHVIAGYYYFTEQGQPRRFPVWPDSYLDDIGLTYDGRTKNTGEKDAPKYFLSFVCYSKEDKGFRIATVPQVKLRGKLERVLGMPDYAMEGDQMSNFFITVSRTKGADGFADYDAIPTLKAPPAALKDKWAEAAPTIWLPALYEGGDPFSGKPAGGHPAGLPPTSRDELGADHELPGTTAPSDWE